MNTTTPEAIRELFIPAIEEIPPSHTAYSTNRWSHVQRLGEVAGTIRNFHVAFGADEEVDEGFHGGGEQMMFVASIWTTYGGLNPNDDDSIISEDRRQIRLTLRGLAESSNDGLISVIDGGWVPDEEEEGHLFGAHTFTVHYLASDSE